MSSKPKDFKPNEKDMKASLPEELSEDWEYQGGFELTDKIRFTNFWKGEGENKRFQPVWLSEYLRDYYKIATLKDNKQIYFYDAPDGIWDFYGEERLRRLIAHHLGDENRKK